MSKNEELFKAIGELEDDIGLRRGFFILLVKEDDWSFIVKLHALYEAAISALLLEKLGHIELEGFLSRLELGDRSRGKLRLIKELNLLESEERKFIYALSEIRNNLVHNVTNTQIGLAEYFKSLDKNKSKDYVDTFGFTYPNFVKIAEQKIEAKKFTQENPKIAIWHNSIYLLFVIVTLSKTERSIKATRQLIMENHALQKTMEELQNTANKRMQSDQQPASRDLRRWVSGENID